MCEFIGEIIKRKVSSIGTVSIAQKLAGKYVYVIENADGSYTVKVKGDNSDDDNK